MASRRAETRTLADTGPLLIAAVAPLGQEYQQLLAEIVAAKGQEKGHF